MVKTNYKIRVHFIYYIYYIIIFVTSLNELEDIIEQLSKNEQIQILQFIIKHSIYCNKHNNGIHINLTNFADDKTNVLKELVAN